MLNLFPKRTRDDSTNMYILNLAFCDIVCCVVCAPIFMLQYIYR